MKQPRDFRYGRLTGDAGVMRRIAQTLTDADIDGLGNSTAWVIILQESVATPRLA